MDKFTGLIFLVLAGGAACWLIWILTDPKVWIWVRDRKAAGNRQSMVSYRFLVNSKIVEEGVCPADKTRKAGKIHFSAERQLGEYMIVPARFILTEGAMKIPPIRVKKGDLCTLEIKEL